MPVVASSSSAASGPWARHEPPGRPLQAGGPVGGHPRPGDPLRPCALADVHVGHARGVGGRRQLGAAGDADGHEQDGDQRRQRRALGEPPHEARVEPGVGDRTMIDIITPNHDRLG